MKFAQDSQDEGHVITAYDHTSVSINGKPFKQSLIITPSKLNEKWPVQTISELEPVHVEQILSLNPELIIVGTGDKLVFPAIEMYSNIIQRGIGIDFMDTGAACRTYNILMSEGRDVVAGLIL